MKKSILSMVLLLFSQVVFTMQDDAKIERHGVIKIIVENYLEEEKEIIIPVVEKSFNRYEYFKDLFLEEKPLEMRFDSAAEASALQKIVKFIQEYEDIKEVDFFETHDFAELIMLAFKLDIKPLGMTIAEFMKAEIKGKINGYKTKILDNLSKDQIVKICRVFSMDAGKKEDWFADAQKELVFYFHFINSQEDPRVENIGLTYDANFFALVSAAQAHAIHNNKKSQADEIFRREVEEIVSGIFDTIVQNTTHQSCCERYENTLSPRTHSSLVAGKYAKEVVVALQNRLDAYEVFLNTEDWKPKSQLTTDKPWPRTPGGYCASVCGLSVCWFASPLQYCFCALHESCCPHACPQVIANHNFVNTQVIVAIRHCVYKGATCFKRWIIVKPRDYSGGPKPVISPPREEML